MKKHRANKIIQAIQDTIFSIEFLNQFRTSEKYFTRKRKLTFVNLIAPMTNFLTKSSQAELNQYIDFMNIKERISQQAQTRSF